MSEPTVITLNNENSIQILHQYVELAQSKGAFILQEADLLKRACDILFNNVTDNEINIPTAKNLLIQGVQKGQRHGAYTLADAATLHKIVQFVAANLEAPVPQKQEQEQDDDSLSDLADPIPLKPKEI